MASTVRRLIPLLPAALALLAGCGGDERESAERAAQVVATTTQVGDLTRAVAGRRAKVTQLLKANSDPHEFEPRPGDARALSEADLLVASGGDLDTWSDDLNRSAAGNASSVKLIDSVEALRGEHEQAEGARADGEKHGDGAVDPHWWQDPTNAVRAVEAIRRALSAADPEGRPAYAKNAHAYTQRLRRLDRSIASCVERIPEAKRKLVTTHDALGYYARRYDIEVVGALIPSLSTQAQPSGRDIQELVGQIRSEGVEAIFPESALGPRLEQAVAREAGVKVGGELSTDTLGAPGSGAETYPRSLSANTATLVEGMSGGKVRCRPRA
ncbi:MAG: metal ABC transporter substrate-binding protein [Actinomycetota bacterium]|nr:metal ABC transporter substrate-binding protein [Actinomycetota bacterium]